MVPSEQATQRVSGLLAANRVLVIVAGRKLLSGLAFAALIGMRRIKCESATEKTWIEVL